MPMKNPPHPGDFIRTEIIEPAGLSVTAAATVLRVSRPALSSLLNTKADLSGEMALRIEKAFGVKMETLIADAIGFRHCQDSQPREGNQRHQALSPHRRAPTLNRKRSQRFPRAPERQCEILRQHLTHNHQVNVAVALLAARSDGAVDERR